ncbi:hypothetical protein BJX62DRAFT_9668 [Aspergillus germanicus]
MLPWEIDEILCIFYMLRNRIQTIWDAMVTLNSLFTSPLDSPVPDISEMADIPGYQCFDGLSSVVNTGPAFVYDLLQQQRETRFDSMLDTYVLGSSHLELFLYSSLDIKILYPAGAVRYFRYPADQYKATSRARGEIEEILSNLPKVKQPGPCWKSQWDRAPVYGTRCLHNMLITGWIGSKWDWGFAFWDQDRIVQWKMPTEPYLGTL